MGGREPGGLPGPVRRHFAGCRACRAGAAFEGQLTVELRAEAQRTRVPAPPFLACRIAQAVGREDLPSRELARPLVRLAKVAVPIGVILAAWHLAVRDSPPPPRQGQAGAHPSATRGAGAESETTLALASALSGADRLLELGHALDQPLQAEFDAVVQDARTAVQSLASSFLPRPQP